MKKLEKIVMTHRAWTRDSESNGGDGDSTSNHYSNAMRMTLALALSFYEYMVILIPKEWSNACFSCLLLFVFIRLLESTGSFIGYLLLRNLE